MGIWDFINSTTDILKRNAPDLTPVKHACRSSYDYSWAACTQIDKAVRANIVPTVKRHLPDDDGRAKIGRIATSVVKNSAGYACREGCNSVPGGVFFYNVLSRSLRDEKTEDSEEVIKALQARVDRLERESSARGKLPKQAEMLCGDDKLDSRNAPCLDSNTNLKPNDLISIFMMKEFAGRHILDDLIVRGVGHGRKDK